MLEPGFPLLDQVCFCNTSPVRGPNWSGGIRTGSHTSLTRCHRTLADLHAISLFLPLKTFLKYFTAPESCARLFSPKCSSIFIPLIHSASSSTLSLFCSTGCSQDIFLTVFLSSDSNISLPLPLPLPNHPEIYSLVDIDFLLSSILLSGFLFFPPIICKLHRFNLSLCWKSYHERETFLFSFFN